MKPEIDPIFYQFFVGVPMNQIPDLWKLIDQKRDVILNLIDFKARRLLKSKMAEMERSHLAPSKFMEGIKNKISTKEEIEKELADLEIHIAK